MLMCLKTAKTVKLIFILYVIESNCQNGYVLGAIENCVDTYWAILFKFDYFDWLYLILVYNLAEFS